MSNHYSESTCITNTNDDDIQVGASSSLLDKLNDFGDNLVYKVISPYLGFLDEDDLDDDDLYYLPPEPESDYYYYYR